MSAEVDDLFGGGAPPAPPTDPLRGLSRLVAAATITTVVGPFCFLSVPAALLVMWAWYRCDEELQRGRAGLLTAAQVAEVRRLKRLTFAMVWVSLALMGAQIAVLGWFLGQGDAGG